MQCNIDARGRAMRLMMGIAMLTVAIVLALLWAMPTGSVLAWILSAVFATGGAFGIYEGWAGWCVVRAMGFKTRI